jgi:Putative Actinobacterial Holin-X, holin superfamily III
MSSTETRTHDLRELPELFADLTRQLSALVQQEWQLARIELTQKASRLGRDAGMLVAGAAIGYAGFLAILAAIIIGLATLGMAWWLAALIVGLVVAAIGGLLIQQGVARLQREELAPRRTLNTLRDDALVLKREVQT